MEPFSDPAFMSVFWGILAFAFIIGIFMVVCMCRLYTMAGQPGWAAIVPIYNYVVMLRIIQKPWWWILLILIPYIGMIWGIWSLNLFVKSFGKGTGYTVGVIFLPFIFLPMLAFSSDTRFQGTSPASEGAALDQVF